MWVQKQNLRAWPGLSSDSAVSVKERLKMELELIYETQDLIPTGMEALYSERGGKWHLTGVKGMKTQVDIDRMRTGLDKEREAHLETKDKLRAFADVAGGKTPEEIQTELDEIDELRIKAEKGGEGPDKEKVEELISKRVDREVAKVQRQLDASKTELGEVKAGFDKLTGEVTKRDLHAHLREVGETAKLRDGCVDDFVRYAEGMFVKDEISGEWISKDEVGVSPGLPAETVLGDLQATRSHWWPESVGAGAKGGKGGGVSGANPWTAANWNITAQTQFMKVHGMDKAKAAAQAAGSSFAATRPPEK